MPAVAPIGRTLAVMRRFVSTRVDDAVAAALLEEYVAYRIATFPVGSVYRVSTPDPSAFLAPAGVFLVAEVDGVPVGCGGVRDLGGGRWEVKHLWLRASARGGGHGRALLTELERLAAAGGAAELVLDTNDSLTAAGVLYRSSGFEPIAAYNDNPNATTWFAKRLR